MLCRGFAPIKFFTFLFIGVFSCPASAQSTVDSLTQRLAQHATRDSVRVDLLNRLGHSQWVVAPQQSVQRGKEALALAQQLSYDRGMAYAYRIIGVAHWAQGNYETGLEHLMQSSVAYQTIGDTLGTANVMMNIGLIYQDQGSYEEALAYYQEALTTFELLNRPDRWVNTANHQGELHLLTEDYGQAQTMFEEALRRSDSLDYAYGRATALQNLGGLYEVRRQWDEALAFSEQALAIQQQYHFVHSEAITLYTIGTIHLARNELKPAEAKLRASLNKANEVNSKKIRKNIYQSLKEVSVAQGNYRAALDYAEEQAAVQDSLLNAEKLRDMVRLENRFALENKDRELTIRDQMIELLEQDRKIKAMWRNIFAVGLLLLLWLTLIGFRVYRSRHRKNQQLLIVQQALAQTELENARLRSQELQQELHYKNKELTSYTLNFVQKNKLMDELNDSLRELTPQDNPKLAKKLRAMQRLVQQSTSIDRDWEDFKRHFENVHQDFFTLLKQRCPDLTHNELKLCALLKLNLNLKEVAAILGIAAESVKTARYRLRKKFDLTRDDSLLDHIMQIEADSLETATAPANGSEG